MDWTRILTNVAGEFFAPTTAAYALAAIGLNIHFGLTGLLNMGQAGFMLLGAYGFAIATIAGWPLWAAVLIAIAAATIFALILGIPTLKLRGDYLAIVTIAAAEIVRLVGRSTALTELTGASSGLRGNQYKDTFQDASPFDDGTLGARPVRVRRERVEQLVDPDRRLGRRRRSPAGSSGSSSAARGAACSRASARTRTPCARSARTSTATRCRRSCSAASSASLAGHPLRAATSRPTRLHGQIHDVLHLDDPAARRGGDRVRSGARLDHLLGGPQPW